MLGNIVKMSRLSRLRHSYTLCASLTAITVPIALSGAALSFISTIIIFFSIALIIMYMKHSILNTQQREKEREKSHIFIVWLASSVLTLMIVFHMFVINLLEILPEENFILLILATSSVACLYNAKQRAHQIAQVHKAYSGDIEATSEDIENLIPNNSNSFCFLCQANIPNRQSHCMWLDCCIGSENSKLFTSGIFLGMMALFYGSNLTLTTVCHPFIFYKFFLLPDDCSDVYYEFNTAISFVCGIYSFVIGAFILLFFVMKIVKKFGCCIDVNIDPTSNRRWYNVLLQFFCLRII